MKTTNRPEIIPDVPDEMIDAYIECALWSSVGTEPGDEDGEMVPLDENHDVDDIDPETRAAMEADCKAFWEANWKMIESDPSQAGHDFWLTRCGHGAGFGDGDWPEEVDDILDESASAFGNVDLYVGDDNKIYSV